MIDKQASAISGILDFDEEGINNSLGKKIADGCEVAYLILTSQTGSAGTVDVHDCTAVADANYNNKKMTLDCSNVTNDTRIFPNPVSFARGLTVVLVQGDNNKIVLSYGTVAPR